MKRYGWWGALLALGLAVPAEAAAQTVNGSPVEVGGLLRTGFRAEPDSTGRTDGFDIFDARLKVSGEVGIVFDYFAQIEYDRDDDAFQLLDAKATVPIVSALDLSLGQFRPRFGLEALQTKGEITFVERAQASTAIAPGRQVGIDVGGTSFDGRLTYGGGLFNGNGRTLDNDGNDFMFAGRVQFNSIGTIAFYEDFVFQVGASIGGSTDTAAPLGSGAVTGDDAGPSAEGTFAGDRTIWGLDAQLTYRGWSLTGEYLRAAYDLDAPLSIGSPRDGEVELSDGGGYVELGYRAYGAIEGVVRYDTFDPALVTRSEFLLFGLNVYPGYYAKFGVQYAVSLGDPEMSGSLANNQFILLAQVDF